VEGRVSRILLVDDDPCLLLIIESALFAAGHHVDTAETFKAGDGFLSSHSYDAVVTDGLLPDGKGMILVDKATERGIPALVITGYLDGLRHCYPTIDFNKYTILRKPVSPSVLLETVEVLLAGG
jgi:two-component system, NtrC family, nitrogen regulation response regulator GlnG